MFVITALCAATVVTGVALSVRAIVTDGYGFVPTRTHTHVFDVR